MPKYKIMRTYVIEAADENEALKKYYGCEPQLRDAEYLHNLEIGEFSLADERKIVQSAQINLDAVFRHTTLDDYFSEQELRRLEREEEQE